MLFFSLVFPLSPLLALIYNLALIRLDAMKLCYARKRPIAVKTSGIGVWEDVIQIMSVIAILTNCAVLGITSKQLRGRLARYGPGNPFIIIHSLFIFIIFIIIDIIKISGCCCFFVFIRTCIIVFQVLA